MAASRRRLRTFTQLLDRQRYHLHWPAVLPTPEVRLARVIMTLLVRLSTSKTVAAGFTNRVRDICTRS